MADLLPCPRCNGAMKIVSDGEPMPFYSVDCSACPLSFSDGFLSPNIATAAWNNRPTPPHADIDRIRELFGRILPIETRDTPDYAELTFGDHSTQAMTMDPQTWREIGDALPALLSEYRAQSDYARGIEDAAEVAKHEMQNCVRRQRERPEENERHATAAASAVCILHGILDLAETARQPEIVELVRKIAAGELESQDQVRAQRPRADDEQANERRRRLAADLKRIHSEFEFTATRVGDPGCEVRNHATENAAVIEVVMREIGELDRAQSVEGADRG